MPSPLRPWQSQPPESSLRPWSWPFSGGGNGLRFSNWRVAVYLLVARTLRDRVPLFAYLSAVNALAGLALLAAMVWVGTWSELLPLIGTEEVLAMIGLGLICSVVGHTLLNYCVRLVPVHLVSLGILAEPVIATISTWIAFHEVPTAAVGIGGAIIVAGIYLGFGWRRVPSSEASPARVRPKCS